MDFVYPHRNGETTPPELVEDDWAYYWFDGIAHYENWTRRGDLVVVTGKGADRVEGLVVVAKMPDAKHPKFDAHKKIINSRAAMMAEVESVGYDLDKCKGRWWGPVHVPELSGDILSSWAAVLDYEEWKEYGGNDKEIGL